MFDGFCWQSDMSILRRLVPAKAWAFTSFSSLSKLKTLFLTLLTITMSCYLMFSKCWNDLQTGFHLRIDSNSVFELHQPGEHVLTYRLSTPWNTIFRMSPPMNIQKQMSISNRSAVLSWGAPIWCLASGSWADLFTILACIQIFNSCKCKSKSGYVYIFMRAITPRYIHNAPNTGIRDNNRWHQHAAVRHPNSGWSPNRKLYAWRPPIGDPSENSFSLEVA